MKHSRRALLFFFALCVLLVLPFSAHAQSSKSVLVQQRDADITLLTNGDVQFVETWVVEFRNGPFTFAFREIPISRLRDIIDVSVTENNITLDTDIGTDDKRIKFTWHFPSTNQGANFSSDTHTYIVRYTVRGAMRIYPDGDQFWWKFIEKDRAYPIQSARARVHLPGAFNTDQLKATTYLNSDDIGGGTILDGSTVEFSGGPFAPDTEWEIRTQFPHTVTAPPEEWQVWDDRVEQIAAQNNLYAAVIGVVLLFGGPLLLLLLWYLYGRDKPVTFQAEFLNAPPDNTPPGVVGTLLDERADLQDIVATVADLARRGYIRIVEGDAFGTPEYERTSKQTTELAHFEKETLDALLRGNAMRRLEDVRGSFYYSINTLQKALYDEVVTRGFFPASPLATRDLYFRIAKWGAILVPSIGICAYCVAFIFAPLAFFPVIMLELFFIGLLGLSRVMPRRTAQGALAAAKWNAFRRYLTSVEKYTRVDEAQDQFAKYLPYAIAFGLEKSWIDKFKRTTTPAPKWYVPFSVPVSNTDWRWSDVGNVSSSDSTPSRDGGSIFGPSTPTSPTASSTPIFSDNSEPRVPSLNEAANSSFLALNSVSSNMFDFLNTSAEAFTTKPATRSTASQVAEGVGSFLNWVGSSSGSSSDSGGGGGWSGGSSSSSSSSGGGGGGGGGSSGFG